MRPARVINRGEANNEASSDYLPAAAVGKDPKTGGWAKGARTVSIRLRCSRGRRKRRRLPANLTRRFLRAGKGERE